MSSEKVPYKHDKAGRGIKKSEPVETGDLTAIIQMSLDTNVSRAGRPADYPDTVQGLDDFVQKTMDFFEYVNQINSNPEIERKLIPDIEAWAAFLGITRQTIWSYEHRGKDWHDVITYYKGVIGAVKKQLALHGKIPPVVFALDFTNNHNYYNTSEFRFSEERVQDKEKSDSEIMKSLGLIVDEIPKNM